MVCDLPALRRALDEDGFVVVRDAVSPDRVETCLRRLNLAIREHRERRSSSPGEDIARLAPWFHNLHLPDGRHTAADHPLGDFPSTKWRQIESGSARTRTAPSSTPPSGAGDRLDRRHHLRRACSSPPRCLKVL